MTRTKRGALCPDCAPVYAPRRSGSHSKPYRTSNVGTSFTGWVRFQKFGDVACTIWWISSNCSGHRSAEAGHPAEAMLWNKPVQAVSKEAVGLRDAFVARLTAASEG